MDVIPVRRALLSASDKRGLVDFARRLAACGVELLSTGGTAAALREAGLAVVEVGELTGAGEFLDGRVKTLHPAVHGAILARRDREEHRQALEARAITPIDLVVVNLYPFEATVAGGGDFDAGIETIDIGGPAMIRAAAKNHAFVAVVVEPEDYEAVAAEIERHGGTTLTTRRQLAARAFRRTAAYDAAIARWLTAAVGESPLAERFVLAGERLQTLRYGENPHQQAALYRSDEARPGAVRARQLQGKALSYNNLLDADAAFELAAEFDQPAVVIVKHNNPCGVAVGHDPVEVWKRALASDPVSAFGGIVALNHRVEAELAQELTRLFLEVVIAPEFAPEARELLARKANLRLLETGGVPRPDDNGLMVRTLAGGFLVQERDRGSVSSDRLEVVTRRAPTEAELADLLFAWKVVKHVRSNAIVLARARATVGVGAGQMSRVDAVRLAVEKARAGRGSRGAVLASDAFFPFADGLVEAARAGVTAVIQPGGSVRDGEVIAAADEHDMAMVFTRMRHFRH